MKVYLGNDHTAVEMKTVVKKFLEENNYTVIDLGPNSIDSVDYPEFGKLVAEKVASDSESFGVIICGTGIGISIAANRIKGARAALVYEDQTAMLSRQHNNANIIALGARMISNDKAVRLINIFLNTNFEGERHQKRVLQLDE